jgi:hypothetical protein
MSSLNKLLETISEFIHFIYNGESVLVTWTHALSNSRQHTLAVVLLNQLSSSALRKEVSGYKCCDVIVSQLISILSRVYLYRRRIRAFHLFSHIVCCRVGCKSDVVVVVISLSA